MATSLFSRYDPDLRGGREVRLERIQRWKDGEAARKRQTMLEAKAAAKAKAREEKARLQRLREAAEHRHEAASDSPTGYAISGAGGNSRPVGTPRLAGNKVKAERMALASATAGEAALDTEISRSQQVLAALERGEMHPDWESRFKARHGGRPPDEMERDVRRAALEEAHAQRVLRHSSAAAAVEVLEAEHALLRREISVAQKGIKQWEQRRRKQSGSLPTEEERANNPELRKLVKLIAECNKGLKRNEKRCRAARDREVAWPGLHWQRGLAAEPLQPVDETDDEIYSR